MLGTIIGKSTTLQFKFGVQGNAEKFQYVQVPQNDGLVLAQIVEIEQDSSHTTATCSVIGKRDGNTLIGLKTPLSPQSEVNPASDEFIVQTLGLAKKDGAYIGTLNGREHINVYLDLNKLLSKHVVILAKTGAGKSYATGVLLEELLDRNIPMLIFDPHGEYSTLKFPNSTATEVLEKHGLKPKAYHISEYSPNVQDVPTARALKLDNQNLTAYHLQQLLPAKLSTSQASLLYGALRNMKGPVNFQDLIMALEAEDSNVKYSVINIIEYLQRLSLFSEAPTRLTELIQPGKASIINLKGAPPDVQEIIVYKLAHDLFEARKKGNVAPFLMVLEEAQNYCPERSFGEAKSSKIIRQIASEGRKFGISLAVISQRPSRIDKSVLSQANTQLILKVTNPHDIRAITTSVEGITVETEQEIRNIPIGTAMITGIADLPLLVDIRPRKSKHGGETINPLLANAPDADIEGEETDMEEKMQEIQAHEGELLPIIAQHASASDVKLIHGKNISTVLIPCKAIQISQNNEEIPLVINLVNNEFITDINTMKSTPLQLPKMDLSPSQYRIFDIGLKLGTFKPADLFAKSGLQFSEIYDTITGLSNKGLFVKKGDQYLITPSLSSLMNLKHLACYEKVDYAKITYDKKMNTMNTGNEIIQLISKFASITNEKDCWLVSYQKN